MAPFALIQLIGFVGAGLDIFASLNKKDSRLIYLHSLGSFIFSIHYFLLGAYPGAIAELLNGTRTGLSALTKHRFIAYGFLALYTALVFIIPDKLLDTLPFIASLSITTGLYFFKAIRMRLFYLAAWTLWLIYSSLVFSLGGIALFSILIVATLVTIFRLQKTKNC